jgi:hypothetical protein
VFISPRHVCGTAVGAMVFDVLDLFHGLLLFAGFVSWVCLIFFSLFIFTFFIVVVVFGIGGDEVEVGGMVVR